VSWYVCNKQGFCDGDKVDKKTEKGSMQIGCKGHVKVKLDVKGNYWFFDILTLEHNHPLRPKPRMIRFMCAHKVMEDGIKNLMGVMTRAGVQHQAQMIVMSELHGGWDSLTFTERDMRNRYDCIQLCCICCCPLCCVDYISCGDVNSNEHASSSTDFH
jgi:hypothetical protein